MVSLAKSQTNSKNALETVIFTVARNTVLLLKRQKGYAEGKTRRRRLKDVMFAVCLQVS